MTTDGWAVLDNRGINIRSVSPSRRAAIVNWLCVEKGILTLDVATDAQIERVWEENCGGAVASKVTILVVTQ